MPQFKVLAEGLSYQTDKGEKHVKQGAIVDGADLGEKGLKWLLADGYIEPVGKSSKTPEKSDKKPKAAAEQGGK